MNLMAQSPRLARSYYQAGEYEKAIELYKELHKKHAYRTDYFKLLVTSYQQLEKFNLVLNSLKNLINNLCSFYAKL